MQWVYFFLKMPRRSATESLVVHWDLRGFWRSFVCAALCPIPLLILFAMLLLRKTQLLRFYKATVPGAQCGTALAAFVWSTIASWTLLVWGTAHIPRGIAVVPLVYSGAVAPLLTFIGLTNTFQCLHNGRRHLSSIPAFATVAVSLLILLQAALIVVHSIGQGMFFSM